MKTWFKLPEKSTDLPDALDKAIRAIEESPGEKKRRENLVYDLELYYGCRLGSLYDVRFSGADAMDWEPENLQYNIVFALVSTVRNRICSFRPRADFSPTNGDFRMRTVAKDWRASCDAWFKRDKIYREVSFMVRDILTSDAGVIKAYSDDTQVYGRRFPSWEFLVSEADGRYRDPECMFHVRWVALEEALAQYGDEDPEDPDRQLDVAIRSGVLDGTAENIGVVAYATGKQLVRVADCYKRGPNGRHVIMVGRKIVLDKPWKHDGFPFIVKRFDERAIGYWGVSGINSIRGLQLALNEEMGTIETAHHMTSAHIIQVQEGEAVPKVDNNIVRIVRYQTQPHQITAPPAMNAERYRYVEELRKIGYEVWGVSQFVASGVKQPGVESAVAIRESTELQSDRLALLSQMNEEIVVELADWWRKLSEELPNKQKWQVMQRGMLREVTNEPMGKDATVEVLPTSLFGQSVAGRVDKAMDYVKRGWLSKQDAMRAVDVPDLAPIMDLELAETYYMEQIVDDILEEGVYETPSEYLDPNLMVAYAKKRFFAAKTSGVKYPPGNLGKLTKLIDAETKRASASAPQSAAPSAAPGAAPAPGGAAPPPEAAPPMPGGPPAGAPPPTLPQ